MSNIKLHKIADIVNEWDEFAGLESESHRVFGPQSVSVEFVVNKLREVLDN